MVASGVACAISSRLNETGARCAAHGRQAQPSRQPTLSQSPRPCGEDRRRRSKESRCCRKGRIVTTSPAGRPPGQPKHPPRRRQVPSPDPVTTRASTTTRGAPVRYKGDRGAPDPDRTAQRHDRDLPRRPRGEPAGAAGGRQRGPRPSFGRAHRDTRCRQGGRLRPRRRSLRARARHGGSGVARRHRCARGCARAPDPDRRRPPPRVAATDPGHVRLAAGGRADAARAQPHPCRLAGRAPRRARGCPPARLTAHARAR